MANVNKVILIGNVTRDPELKYTPKGTAVTDLGLAVNRYYTLDGGEKREETTFVDVTLWGRQAEIAGQYLKKGSPVYVEGRLQMDSWEDKQTGQKRNRLRVVAENLQLLGNRPAGSRPPLDSGYESPPAAAAMASSPPPFSGQPARPSSQPDDDDIPF